MVRDATGGRGVGSCYIEAVANGKAKAKAGSLQEVPVAREEGRWVVTGVRFLANLGTERSS